jgi:hypothetical protein
MDDAERRELLGQSHHAEDGHPIPAGPRDVGGSRRRVDPRKRQRGSFYTLHSSRLKELSRF